MNGSICVAARLRCTADGGIVASEWARAGKACGVKNTVGNVCGDTQMRQRKQREKVSDFRYSVAFGILTIGGGICYTENAVRFL